MKKLLLFTILTLVLASAGLATAEKKGSKAKTCSEDKVAAKCKDAEDVKAQAGRCRKGYKGGFDKSKKHHKNLISQLKKIRDIAAKENATETVKAIDELVDKTQKRFHEKAKLLKHKEECWKKGTKSKSCPIGCTMPCCAAKKKSGTCPMASEEKKAESCSKTKAEKTGSDK